VKESTTAMVIFFQIKRVPTRTVLRASHLSLHLAYSTVNLASVPAMSQFKPEEGS